MKMTQKMNLNQKRRLLKNINDHTNKDNPKLKITKEIMPIPRIEKTTKMKTTPNMKMTKNLNASQYFNSLTVAVILS